MCDPLDHTSSSTPASLSPGTPATFGVDKELRAAVFAAVNGHAGKAAILIDFFSKEWITSMADLSSVVASSSPDAAIKKWLGALVAHKLLPDPAPSIVGDRQWQWRVMLPSFSSRCSSSSTRRCCRGRLTSLY